MTDRYSLLGAVVQVFVALCPGQRSARSRIQSYRPYGTRLCVAPKRSAELALLGAPSAVQRFAKLARPHPCHKSYRMAASCHCTRNELFSACPSKKRSVPTRRRCDASSCSTGRWSLSERDGYVYTPADCDLVRPTVATVRQCLSGRHLLFFGDSMQRYLYLTLTNFLVNGEWPRDEQLRPGGESPCSERTWGQDASTPGTAAGWERYFKGTNAALRGHEICDCWRSEKCCKETELTENRYTQVGNAAVSFVTQLDSAEWPPHGTIAPGSHRHMRTAIACEAGACRNGTGGTPWSMLPHQFMESALPALGVTDVIINSGQHYTTLGKPDRQRAVKRMFAAAAASVGPKRVWFRTTTPRFKNSAVQMSNLFGDKLRSKGWAALPDVEDEMDAADANGVGVLDMFEVIMRMKHSSLNISEQEGAFVDEVHVKCSVNRELLSLILAAICG